VKLPSDFVPPPPRERFDVTSADGTRLSVEVHGPKDGPTVVLAHGWTCSAGFWGRVLNRVHAGVRTVVFDQRGHGRSAAVPAHACTEQSLSDDLDAVLEATVPDGERCVVAGHSMGAMGLIALSARRPEVVRAKVAAALLASTGVGQLVARARAVPLPPPFSRAGAALTRQGMSDARVLATLPHWAARIAIGHITLSPAASAVERAYCTDVVLACPAATRLGFATMLDGLNLAAALPALDLPVLVVVGSEDRLTPPWHARRIADALPQSLGVMELPGIGHMTPLQTPDVLADALHGLVTGHLRSGLQEAS
jgi:pimeloyl-ACP methyl ester carboxylesterase